MSQEKTVNLDTRVFDDVLLQGGADARKELARQLADFLRNPDTPKSERKAVVPTLLKLAADPVYEVRYATAQHLSSVSGLDIDILFSIIADEESIALPFLLASPALDEAAMTVILELGDFTRQIQVASRKDITRSCISTILAKCDWKVCAALLDNQAFEPSDTQYRTLFSRFHDTADIVDRLIARPDLPLEIRILHAKRSSSRMHRYLNQSGFQGSGAPAEIVADAEETAVLSVLACAGDGELDRAIPFLLSKNLLTASLVLRSAAVGEMRVVERALSQLSRMQLHRVESMLYAKNPMASKAVLARTGLSDTTQHLLRAAIDVEREIRERAEDVSSDTFGIRMVEMIVAHYDRLTGIEKNKLLSLMVRYGTVKASAIASRLRSNLSRAA